MKLIENKAELLPYEPSLEGIYKIIELAGRTCYKSEDKITPESAKPFVYRMIASGHTAMLEHGTVYLKYSCVKSDLNPLIKYREHKSALKYSKCYIDYNDLYMTYYVTTNLRVLHENGWMDDLKYLCEPTKYHERRITFKLITSIGVTRELNRHRVNSIAEQSTRYCNYSKDKYDNQVTFCKPAWINLNTGIYEYKFIDNIPEKDFYVVGDGYLIPTSDESLENRFLKNCLDREIAYMDEIKDNQPPQQAREVLPLCTATEAVYTAFASDWKHFFDLRYFEKTGKVHPNMKELVIKMKEVAEQNGICEDIMN